MITLVVLRDPDTNEIVKKSFMCNTHQIDYENQGYDLTILKGRQDE